MMAKFDEYRPFVGKWLSGFSVGKCGLTLNFSGEKESRTELRLSTMADICLEQENLFSPYSEYDTYNPRILETVYSFLEKKVVFFSSINGIRACKIEFSNGHLFCWANKGELPDSLFEAREYQNGERTSWWLIDNV
ncbi:hypothetical protein [Litorimonas sp. WD9-15]|uniref:hypothetical protein n=1 Tax=Litorimonas sp. WD9-15 TaxID=3418716 RepID=UPI003D040656